MGMNFVTVWRDIHSSSFYCKKEGHVGLQHHIYVGYDDLLAPEPKCTLLFLSVTLLQSALLSLRRLVFSLGAHATVPANISIMCQVFPFCGSQTPSQSPVLLGKRIRRKIRRKQKFPQNKYFDIPYRYCSSRTQHIGTPNQREESGGGCRANTSEQSTSVLHTCLSCLGPLAFLFVLLLLELVHWPFVDPWSFRKRNQNKKLLLEE